MQKYEVTFREGIIPCVETVEAKSYAVEEPFLVFYNGQAAKACFKLYDVFKFKLIDK